MSFALQNSKAYPYPANETTPMAGFFFSVATVLYVYAEVVPCCVKLDFPSIFFGLKFIMLANMNAVNVLQPLWN